MNDLKVFRKIMEKSGSNRVAVLTAHYYIKGDVYDCEDCNKDSFINLTNVRVCNVNDSYEDSCDNDKYFDWLHVNINSVIAYSFI